MARSNVFTAKDLAFFVPDDNVGEVSTGRAASGRDSDEEDDVLLKPKIDTSKKTTRYFPGKAPQWVAEAEADTAPGLVTAPTMTGNIVIADSSSSSSSFGAAETISASVVTDSRMARLMATAPVVAATGSVRGRRIVSTSTVNETETESDAYPSTTVAVTSSLGRTVFAGAISTEESAGLQQVSGMEATTASAASAAAVAVPAVDRRLQQLQRMQQQLDASAKPTTAGGSDTESASEYETVTDSSSEEEEEEVMLRPVFVPRNKRATLVSVEEQQRSEEAREQLAALRKEEKSRATRLLVAESIQRADAAEAEALRNKEDGDSDAECPDVNDDSAGGALLELCHWADRDLETMPFPPEAEAEGNQKAQEESVGPIATKTTADSSFSKLRKQAQFDELVREFRLWKVREMGRCVREARLAAQRALEAAELKRLHGLTDDQRLLEQQRQEGSGMGRPPVVEKEQRKFLQKYYHKGAFYHDNDTAEERAKEQARWAQQDTATLGDNTGIDKSTLPAVLQVKKFGMRGQTKYTHLTDQDTTYSGSGGGLEARRQEYLNEGYLTVSRPGALSSSSSSNYKKKQRVTE